MNTIISNELFRESILSCVKVIYMTLISLVTVIALSGIFMVKFVAAQEIIFPDTPPLSYQLVESETNTTDGWYFHVWHVEKELGRFQFDYRLWTGNPASPEQELVSGTSVVVKEFYYLIIKPPTAELTKLKAIWGESLYSINDIFPAAGKLYWGYEYDIDYNAQKKLYISQDPRSTNYKDLYMIGLENDYILYIKGRVFDRDYNVNYDGPHGTIPLYSQDQYYMTLREDMLYYYDISSEIVTSTTPTNTIPPADTTTPPDADPPVIPPLDDYSDGGSDYDSSPAGLSKIPPPENAGQAMAGLIIPGIISIILGILGQSGAAVAPVLGSGLPPTKAGSTQVLQGEKALEWLEQNGLVKEIDGKYVKTGDWNNATAPGAGMRGFVESSQPDGTTVDTDMVILVEIPGAPSSPDQYEFPRDSNIEIPEEPEYTSGDDVETEEPQSKKTKDKEPESEQEIVEEPELESEEESESDADTRQPDADGSHADGGTGEPETAGNGEAGKSDFGSSSEATTEASPEAGQPGGERPVQETIERGRDLAGDAAEGLKEAASPLKDAQGRIKQLQDSGKDLKGLVSDLGIDPKSQAAINATVDEFNKEMGGLSTRLKNLEGMCSSAQEYAEAVKEVLERGGRVIEAYNNMHENLPPYIPEGLRAGVSTYGAAAQAAGEAVDKYVRSLPHGDKLADAFQTGELGRETNQALLTGVENVTHQQGKIYDEVIQPIDQQMLDNPWLDLNRDVPRDELGTYQTARGGNLSTEEHHRNLANEGARARELKDAIDNRRMDYLKEHSPRDYERLLQEDLMEQRPAEFRYQGAKRIRERLRAGQPAYTEGELRQIEQSLGKEYAEWLQNQDYLRLPGRIDR